MFGSKAPLPTAGTLSRTADKRIQSASQNSVRCVSDDDKSSLTANTISEAGVRPFFGEADRRRDVDHSAAGPGREHLIERCLRWRTPTSTRGRALRSSAAMGTDVPIGRTELPWRIRTGLAACVGLGTELIVRR